MARKKAVKQPKRLSFGRTREERSGRWSAAYLHHGVLHRATATFQTKGHATSWLTGEAHLIDLDRITPGTWTPPSERVAKAAAKKLTLRDYGNRWLENKTKLARRTRDNYRGHLDNNIFPMLGDLGFAEITPEHVRSWFAGLGNEHATRNAQAYAVLNGIYNTAVADDLVDRNPCRIKGAAIVKGHRRPVLLDADELAALADEMPDDLRLAVLLAGWCGLRKGEIFALRRGDITADGSMVRVEQAVTYRNRRFEVGPTKTPESRRAVSVPPHIRPAVVEHLRNHVGTAKTALLFADPETGSFAGEKRFRTAWEDARSTAHPELHFHDLRHCAGVMAALTGATTREVMARLGHTSPNTAMRYQHVAAGRADLMAERLSALATAPK